MRHLVVKSCAYYVMLSKCNVGVSLLSNKSHRLGKLSALVHGIEEGKGSDAFEF